MRYAPRRLRHAPRSNARSPQSKLREVFKGTSSTCGFVTSRSLGEAKNCGKRVFGREACRPGRGACPQLRESFPQLLEPCQTDCGNHPPNCGNHAPETLPGPKHRPIPFLAFNRRQPSTPPCVSQTPNCGKRGPGTAGSANHGTPTHPLFHTSGFGSLPDVPQAAIISLAR